MVRGRHKKRGYKQSGVKQDGVTLSLDLCPHCLSFGCDPMAMSHKFDNKVSNRKRKALCPCCGKPQGFCSCKSSMNIAPGGSAIRTHNNRKMRKVMALINEKEAAAVKFNKNYDEIVAVVGDTMADKLYWDISNHNVPYIAYDQFVKAVRNSKINPSDYAVCWMKTK